MSMWISDIINMLVKDLQATTIYRSCCVYASFYLNLLAKSNYIAN